MITVNENGFVSARVLYSELELSRPFSQWFNSALSYGFDNQDYTPYAYVHPQNKQELQDFWLTLDMAKEVAMISKAPKSKEVRKYLISLSDKKDSGELLSQSEVLHLIDLVKCCFVEEFRKLAKEKHLGLYLPKYKTRESHIKANEIRNEVCQIDFEQIKKRLSLISAKAPKSKEAGLIQVDKYELIKIAIIDCMLAFGKSEKVAKNLGKFAKELATKQDSHFTTQNTMYGLPKEYETIYLQLNK
jgi:phage anti-repressor protein